VAENILVRDFQPNRSLQKLIPDSTYWLFGQSMM